MATNTTKPMSSRDEAQVLRLAFNENERSLSVGSFITGKVGHRITLTLVDPTTEDYTYYDNATLIQRLRIIYVDSTKEVLASVERVE